MSREWKPGDVAAVKQLGGGERIAIVGKFGREAVLSPPHFVYANGGYDDVRGKANDARPLVVIDPEDDGSRAAIEITQRIGKALHREPGADLSHIRHSVNEALRSLIAPRKPEEPTGRYAVVEDDSAREWVQADLVGHFRWNCIGTKEWTEYANIAAVRVLSEGVPC